MWQKYKMQIQSRFYLQFVSAICEISLKCYFAYLMYYPAQSSICKWHYGIVAEGWKLYFPCYILKDLRFIWWIHLWNFLSVLQYCTNVSNHHNFPPGFLRRGIIKISGFDITQQSVFCDRRVFYYVLGYVCVVFIQEVTSSHSSYVLVDGLPQSTSAGLLFYSLPCHPFRWSEWSPVLTWLELFY